MDDYATQDENMDLVHSPYLSPGPSSNLANMDQYSSGFQSAAQSTLPSTLPSSSSTPINYTPQPPSYQMPLPPPPPLPPQPRPQSPNAIISELSPAQVMSELEVFMNDSDWKVQTNACFFLYCLLIDEKRGEKFCELVAASDEILNTVYYILENDDYMNKFLDTFRNLTACLTCLSQYPDVRVALLRRGSNQATTGLGALIKSLRSRDGTVAIYTITAIHNLLLDRRYEILEEAKNQVKKFGGLPYIVQLLGIAFDEALDKQCPINNYKFKVVVLDCIQILAWGDMENRLVIRESEGPKLILSNIEDNFDQQSEDLIETASRVLKCLSTCTANKKDIIDNGGIQVLYKCILRNNQEILRTCLWTLRNLSDEINTTVKNEGNLISRLVQRLLLILQEYAKEPCIITCALGTLANLTCNNEPIKKSVCDFNGINLIMDAVDVSLGILYRSNLHVHNLQNQIMDIDILDPAVYALCHLLNQAHYDQIEDARESVQRRFDLFKPLIQNSRAINEDLAREVEKLHNFAFGYSVPAFHYQ